MISCPGCAAPSSDESNYCEECGVALHPQASANPQCGIVSSYPDSCEITELPDLVALSNHGLRHLKNEDSVLVKRIGSRSFLALSDGVSHSQRPELAAHLATSAAVAVYILLWSGIFVLSAFRCTASINAANQCREAVKSIGRNCAPSIIAAKQIKQDLITTTAGIWPRIQEYIG